MAEFVEKRCQDMIPELELMERIKLFDKNEIRWANVDLGYVRVDAYESNGLWMLTFVIITMKITDKLGEWEHSYSLNIVVILFQYRQSFLFEYMLALKIVPISFFVF